MLLILRAPWAAPSTRTTTSLAFPRPGVGPHDVALAIIRAVFAKGYVKNKVMEFVGPGIASMTTDYRNGVDVMTTETTCLSSIWATDEDAHAFLTMHGRGDDYRELKGANTCCGSRCAPRSWTRSPRPTSSFPRAHALRDGRPWERCVRGCRDVLVGS